MNRLVGQADHEALASVAAALEAASGQLVAQQIAALRAIPTYGRVAATSLQRSCARNVVRVAQTLRGSEALPGSIEEDEHVSGRERAMAGIPAEDVIGAYRLVMGVLRDAFVETALDQGLPFDVVLRGTRQLWETTDALSNELVAARRQIDTEIARREEQQRLTFLQRVLTGGLSASEVAAVGSAFGLSPNREYWVIRCRVETSAAQGMLRLLERAGATRTFHPLLGPLDGDLAGIIGARPPALPELEEAVVAVNGPVGLGRLAGAFREASRLLEIAVRFARRGLVAQSDLSIRIAVAQESELGDALLDKYVAPVLAQSAAAEVLLGTLRRYLQLNRNISTCAKRLSIHQNTLRQRLEKFEALTGADLDATETLFEAWWALEYWVLRREEETDSARAPATNGDAGPAAPGTS